MIHLALHSSFFHYTFFPFVFQKKCCSVGHSSLIFSKMRVKTKRISDGLKDPSTLASMHCIMFIHLPVFSRVTTSATSHESNFLSVERSILSILALISYENMTGSTPLLNHNPLYTLFSRKHQHPTQKLFTLLEFRIILIGQKLFSPLSQFLLNNLLTFFFRITFFDILDL